MATFEKRGPFWRVKIRRTGAPRKPERSIARHWPSNGPAASRPTSTTAFVVDRRPADGLLAEILERYRREVTPTKRGAAMRICG